MHCQQDNPTAKDTKDVAALEAHGSGDEIGLAWTYDFLSFFDARLDLGDVPGRVIVAELLDLVLAKDGQVLLGRKLALAEALAGNPLRHDGAW